VLALIPALVFGAAQTPVSLAGVTVVSAVEAHAMMRRGVLVVDTRVAHEYVEQHIQGAVNIPYKEKSAKQPDFDARLDSFDLSRLPRDKTTPVIFYCNAGECWKSYKASKVASRSGYTRIHWLRGGIPEWKAQGLPVE
jgi:rhodanese-related sulfurtransferase